MRGREGEREGKKHRLVASPMSHDWDQTCNLSTCPDGNQTGGDLLVCGMTPNPLSHTGRGLLEPIKANLRLHVVSPLNT